MPSTPYADLEIYIGKRDGERGYPVHLRLSGLPRFGPGYLPPSLLPWVDSADPQADGEKLFQGLFADDTVRRGWHQLRGEAPQRRVRLVIDDEAPELHVVPWELLRDATGDAPQDLAAGVATPFSRFLAVKGVPGHAVDPGVVKILVVVANPQGLEQNNLSPIDIQQELALMAEATQGMPNVQLTTLREPCTLPSLESELQRDGYHILHFVGHGGFADGKAVLFMADDANQVQLVPDHDFAAMITRQQPAGGEPLVDPLQLIFLASCQTATRDTSNAWRGLAPQLVQAGVPAVLAMQDVVPVVTAQAFARAFYRRLLRHGYVDLAANEARAAVLTARLPGTQIPALFMRLADDRLFDAALDPLQERAYLELLVQAFGHWQELYVRQEAERLQEPEQALPRRVGRLPYRNLEHVQEQSGMTIRTRLQMGLADWLLAHHQLALLAVPGCGKSTSLEEVAWEIAHRQLEECGADLPLPVLAPLGGYAAGENWSSFLPRAVRAVVVRSLMNYGDWREQGLDVQGAEEETQKKVRPVVAGLDDSLERLRQQGKLLLLLDGLNELKGGAEGPLRNLVEEFVDDSLALGNLVAVACRIADYRGFVARLNRVELLPFDDERIHQALRAYFAKQGEILWEELVRPENGRIREMLAIPLYMWALGDVLAFDEQGRPRLPANHGIMLARFAGALLEREIDLAKDGGRPTVPIDDEQQVLAEVAFRMRDELASRGSTAKLATIEGFVAAALQVYPTYQPGWILDLAAGAKLIDLGRQEGTFSFWKEPLQEYFAACHLLERFARRDVAACQALWQVPLRREEVAGGQARLGEPPKYPQTAGAWEQTTILAASLAGTEEKRVSADDFVASVLAVNPELAGRCIHEGGAPVSEEMKRRITDRLSEIMVDAGYSTRVRVPCGVMLGRMGDPRFHDPDELCLPDEPMLGFVEVPAGPFVMGSDRRTVAHWNRKAVEAGFRGVEFDDEKRENDQLDIPYRYWMARYPVTNAQYRCFVEDKGYAERWRHCWTEAGLCWLEGDRWNKEIEEHWTSHYQFYRERGQYSDQDTFEAFREQLLRPFLQRLQKDRMTAPSYWTNPDYNAPTQPLVGVTWYEAVAYTNWLNETLRESLSTPAQLRELLKNGYRICLPSEAEWEKAARGGLQIPGPDGALIKNLLEQREWPWGKYWDPNKCNTAEGEERVGWPSPVSMFPDGGSPYDCADMVGNVWEWTRSAYKKYPFVMRPADGSDEAEDALLRVVRGGVWNSGVHDARCAVRSGSYVVLGYYVGVRVVCAPLLF